MKFHNIIFMFLAFLLVSSLSIFMIGLNETIRTEYLFDIVESNLINASNTPTEIYNDYLEFKNSYIFSNTPFITFVNFTGLFMIMYLFYYSWNMGRNAPPIDIGDVFTRYNLLMILLVYLGIIISEYMIDVFIDQLIIQLFTDIYLNVYVYKIFTDWFVYLLLFAMFLSFMANYIKYFDSINN